MCILEFPRARVVVTVSVVWWVPSPALPRCSLQAPATEVYPTEEPLHPPPALSDQEPESQTSEAILEPQPEINGSALPEPEPIDAEEPAEQHTDVIAEAKEVLLAAQDPDAVPESQAKPQPEIAEVANAVPLSVLEPPVVSEAHGAPQSTQPSEPTAEESLEAQASAPEPASGAPEKTSVPVSEVG